VSKFLFTVWPFYGHIHPNIAVAHTLRERGHEVRFYSGSAAREVIEGEGFAFSPLEHVDEGRVTQIIMSAEGIMAQRRNPLRLRAMWREWLLGTVEGQLTDLGAVFDSWRPDVIVCDPAMWGPILVLGERAGIPVSIFAYTAACILPGRDGPLLGLSLPRARTAPARALRSLMQAASKLFTRQATREANALRARHGLPPISGSVTEFTGGMALYLVPSVPEFDYQRTDLPPSVHYVGPCLWNKPADQPPPDWLAELPGGQPIVFVTEGTVPVKEAKLLKSALAGLGTLDATVIMTTGPDRDPVALGLAVPPNVRVERWVPLSDLLPRTDLVVTTGGSGTVMAALKQGIPVLAAPIAWDQPENAWRIVEAGVGLRIPYDRCTPRRLRAAVERLLGEPSFHDHAHRMAEALGRYAGPALAAELLEQLAARPVSASPVQSS